MMRQYQKQFYVYIMANQTNVAIYTCVTSNLQKRVYEHKEKFVPGFAESTTSASWSITNCSMTRRTQYCMRSGSRGVPEHARIDW